MGVSSLSFQCGNRVSCKLLNALAFHCSCLPASLVWVEPTFRGIAPSIGQCGGREVQVDSSASLCLRQLLYSFPGERTLCADLCSKCVFATALRFISNYRFGKRPGCL